MKKLSIVLKKQRREIERLKKCEIFTFRGFGRSCILVFDQLPYKYDEKPDPSEIQENIDNGHYDSLREFDAIHTADIDFEGDYTGSKIKKYKNRTKSNLVELGKIWSDRVRKDFPDARLTIVVHNHEGEWFLDTFNYEVLIEDGIYL